MLTHVIGRDGGSVQPCTRTPEHDAPGANGVKDMTSIFGFPLLPLWIMGAPLIGAVISLAMPAPRHNTIPHRRRREEPVDTATTRYPRV